MNGYENIAGVEQAPVREGDILARKYRVDRVLGVGGMGVVVAATHLQLDQRVALKFMLAEAFQNPEALARFQREARAAVKLKSEHVARVLDTGTLENNSPYIVMEYLEGTDLAAEVEKSGALPPAMVAEYIIQACDALAEAHMLGIIHRDLKPANLFLTRRPDGSPLVKVLDFGISKANSLTEGGLGMTKTASMMGSPLYMSPEQMKSAKDVDARTDVWSLGIIMYELLGGRVPFNSETLGGLMSMVMMEQPLPLQQIRPDVPRDLSELVGHCLEKDPSRRAQSVAQIALGLRPFAPSRAQPIIDRIANMLGASEAPRTSVSNVASTYVLPSALPAASVQTAPGWGSTGAGAPKRTSAGWIGAVVGALIVVGGLGIGATRLLRSKSPVAADAPHASAVVSETATTATATTPTQPTTTQQPTATPKPIATQEANVATATTTRLTPAGATHTSPAHTASAKPIASAQPAAVVVTSTPTATTQKPGMLDTSN